MDQRYREYCQRKAIVTRRRINEKLDLSGNDCVVIENELEFAIWDAVRFALRSKPMPQGQEKKS